MTENGIIKFALALIFCLPGLVYADEPVDNELLIACYDTVWQTVNENHYDSTFGGLDWNEVYDRYRGLVAKAESDDSFIKLVNEMLLELKLSHYAVFHMKEKSKSGSPLLSGGSAGIDIRIYDDEVVVTSVKPDFPAAQAGIKAGYIIESIDGVAVDQIIAEGKSEQVAHFSELRKLNNITDDVLNKFFGQPEMPISITYRDDSNTLHEKDLIRKERPEKTILDEEYPPFYIDFENKRLPGDIGYITFSAFLPPVDEKFIAAVDSMFDLRGLIIDIRGNPGGMHEVGEAIASKLIDKEVLFSIFRYRDRTDEVIVEPLEKHYDGPVVVMIDYMNGSASERFSACIQSIGRAVVIGERSPGIVGPSDLKKLPNGATFMYLVAQSTTPDGTVLEGHGVIPDITVSLDKEALLRGVDTQLERAIEYINSQE